MSGKRWPAFEIFRHARYSDGRMSIPWVRAAPLLALPWGLLACGSGSAQPVAPGPPGAAGAPPAQSGSAACHRPLGRAAVTLTYDDALPSQLSTAAPALAKHDLKATFFVLDVRSDPAPWAALHAAGHELGSHTFKHPCPKSNTWVAPGDANEDYDEARMASELDASLALLGELGQAAPFTFAYPCGVTWLGAQQSYVPLVQTRFGAARGVAPGLAGAGVDLFDVPASFLTGDGAELIALADSARESGSWVVFGFHGVGGDHSPVSAAAHESLLAHLDDHRSELYVATFGELAACLGR